MGVEYMKKVAQSDTELSVEERNLLSVAYKNVIGSRRSSWRILSSILQKQTETAYTSMATNLQKKIEGELSILCKDVLGLLDNHLLANSTSEESKVFFNKMKGDYHRYMANTVQVKHAKMQLKKLQLFTKLLKKLLENTFQPLIHLDLVLHLTTLFSCMKLLMLQKKHALLQNKLLIWLFLNLIH